jgi:hypothetical protein
MGKILDFLFGKSPKIFDKNGQVRHIHPEKKWNDWNSRYQSGHEYNWRNHAGMRHSNKARPKA